MKAVKNCLYTNGLRWKYYNSEKLMWDIHLADREVEILNTTGINNVKEQLHYFEAWQVQDGQVTDFETDNHDDSFRCGNEGTESYFLKASLGHKGDVVIDAKVYWVDIADDIFVAVDAWKGRTVEYAGKLKSVWAKDFSDIKEFTPKTSRRFIHKVNFFEEDVIKQSIMQLYAEKIVMQDSDLIFYLEDILLGSEYEELIIDICKDAGISLCSYMNY